MKGGAIHRIFLLRYAMQHFIGIVPPEPLYSQILDFQRRWKNNAVPHHIEPHITVKAQNGLTEDLAWLGSVKPVAMATLPFLVHLGAPARFGQRVVYLSVTSPEIVLLHETLVRAVRPSPELMEKYYERPGDYIPHLTLGMVAAGLTEEELSEMSREASRIFPALEPFDVTFLRVYRQESQGSPYLILQDLPLDGGI